MSSFRSPRQGLRNLKLRESLAADYTLSFRHLAIGFFAHKFLVAQKSFFFDHAGLLYSNQSPSWVPVCRSDREWERALVGAIPCNIDITPFDAISTVDCMVYLDERSMFTLKEMIVAYDYQPAYSSPSVVDSATGALLMILTHLLMFEHEPKVLPTQANLQFYEVSTTATLKPIPRLCVFASTRLQIEVGDHIFKFPMKEQIEDYVKWEENSYVAMPPDYHDDRFGPRSLIYLILCPMPNQQDLPAYKLVKSRIGLCAAYPHMIQEHHSSVSFSQSDWLALRNLCTLRLSEV